MAEASSSARRRPTPARAAGVLLLSLAPVALAAQDNNYWNLQYGPVAELLGGVVVGSALDLSATYYNPAGFALADDTAYLLSLNTFQLEQLSLDEPPPTIDLSSSRFGAAPALIAGKFPDGWLGSSRLAWSVLTRQEFKLRTDARALGTRVGPPETRFGEEALVDQSLNETWVGLTWSHRLGESAAVGATFYGVYRGQRLRVEVNAQSAAGAEAGSALFTANEHSFSHYRGLAKLGLALDLRTWRLGLAVTTPSFGVFGSGEAGYTRSFVETEPGSGSVVLDNAFAEDLASDYRSPWAVAAGASWQRGATRYHASAEWFAAVDRFEVLDTSPFLEQPGADSLVAALTQQLDSVLNAGLGVEHEFRSGVSAYGAFATDFSASARQPGVANGVASWDIYHLTGGTAFDLGGTRFTLGLAFSFGNDERAAPPPGVGEDPPGGAGSVGQNASVSYRRYKFILGFAFGG